MNKKGLIGLVIGILIVVIAVLALQSSRRGVAPSAKKAAKIRVTTSFYPLYFFAHWIGGDRSEVMNVTPAGAEPHDYEPTAQDVARIEDSRMLVLNGGGLEAWGESIRQNLDPRRTLILTAGEGLTDQQVVEDGKNIVDPHVWLSPPSAKKMIDAIAQGFVHVDPAGTVSYQTNAARLKAELDDLDASYKMGLRDCKLKDIITSHAAFGYLASAYGLNQVSIAGLSPDAEPSPRQLAQIAAFVKSKDIGYIFFESLVSPKLSQTIAREAGAQTLVLNPIEGLSAGELAQGKDYLTEMRDNLDHLQTALQCMK